jgi:L-lactate dehydrogenase complex protein LldF
VKIDIPTILVHLRNQVVRLEATGAGEGVAGRGERASMRLIAAIMGNVRAYRLAQRAGRTAARWIGRGGRLSRALPGPLGAWMNVRDLPEPPRQTFREWWALRERSR